MPGRRSPPMPQAVAAMGDQRVDQRAVFIAGRRVHDQAWRLVEHQQVAILIEDRKRDCLRLAGLPPPARAGRACSRAPARTGSAGSRDRHAVAGGVAGLDQRFDARARDGAERARRGNGPRAGRQRRPRRPGRMDGCLGRGFVGHGPPIARTGRRRGGCHAGVEGRRWWCMGVLIVAGVGTIVAVIVQRVSGLGGRRAAVRRRCWTSPRAPTSPASSAAPRPAGGAVAGRRAGPGRGAGHTLRPGAGARRVGAVRGRDVAGEGVLDVRRSWA